MTTKEEIDDFKQKNMNPMHVAVPAAFVTYGILTLIRVIVNQEIIKWYDPGWFMLICGGMLLIIGLNKYLKSRKKLKEMMRKIDG